MVGHGPSLRFENRVPGGDVNPYLAVAGDDRRRPARHRATSCRSSRAFGGNAYASDAPRVPTTLREAARPAGSAARSPASAFGDDVVDHYANAARVELAAFDAAVTDWERDPQLRADVSR